MEGNWLGSSLAAHTLQARHPKKKCFLSKVIFFDRLGEWLELE